MKELVITGEADILLKFDMAKEQSEEARCNYTAKMDY